VKTACEKSRESTSSLLLALTLLCRSYAKAKSYSKGAEGGLRRVAIQFLKFTPKKTAYKSVYFSLNRGGSPSE